MNKEIQRLKTFDDDEDKYAYHPKVIAKAGFYKVENEFIYFNCNLKLSAKDIETGKNIVEIHQDRDASCTFAHNLPFLPRSRLYKDGDKELRYEMKRLETFINWPGDGKIITLRDLANAGFYYSRNAYICICFYCNMFISFHPEEDTGILRYNNNIIYIHMGIYKYFQRKNKEYCHNCDWVQGKPVGNVPIVEDKILKKILGRYSIYPLDGSLLRYISGNSNNLRSHDNTTKNDKKLSNMNIQPYHRPIHKKYATEESRRSTYYDKDNWPLKDQSFVEKLVEAGFYYTGK